MGSSTNRWSREELEEAWSSTRSRWSRSGKTWDWSSYADHFTEDAKYVEHAFGNMEGRENIREWIVSTMNTFPGSEMPFYPVEWYSIDADKGWVIFKNINTMKDPGDGSVHGAPVITVLEYAGDEQVELRGRRLQPDELPADGAGATSSACHELGTHLRRRADVRQEHELGTDLNAPSGEVRSRPGFGLPGPGPVVDEAPRAQAWISPYAFL